MSISCAGDVFSDARILIKRFTCDMILFSIFTEIFFLTAVSDFKVGTLLIFWLFIVDTEKSKVCIEMSNLG